MGTWVDFRDTGSSSSGKTQIWQVVTTYDGGGIVLGEIRWFGRWRKYAFYPAVGTVFEPTCLRDIAVFIEKQMNERKSER